MHIINKWITIICIKQIPTEHRFNAEMVAYITTGNQKMSKTCNLTKWTTQTSLIHVKNWGERRCSGRISSSCSTSGTRRVTLVTNLVISHKWGKKRIVITTNRRRFEDTKEVIHHSMKNRQHSGQMKKDKQQSTKHTHKTNDQVTRTPLNAGAPEG